MDDFWEIMGNLQTLVDVSFLRMNPRSSWHVAVRLD
jgi:hypothetical protein